MIEHVISRQGSALWRGRIGVGGILAMTLFLQTRAAQSWREFVQDQRTLIF
jgi:hypothetical protein